MFKRISGKPRLEWWPKKASTAISYGALVGPDGSTGTITPATSTSTELMGIAMRKVASTDADYATALAKIPVDALGDDDVFEATVTGTLTTTMVGTHLDLSDSLTVNAGGTSHKPVLCVGFISATLGLFKVNARASSTLGA